MSLTPYIDYSVDIPELTEPGEYTLTITGVGNYTGQKEVSYTILAPNEPKTLAEKVDWIVENCQKENLSDEWEIALWLHDWLINNANYDYTYTYYSPEGVLLKGKGVCQSYADAYSLLLKEFDIENHVVIAPEMDHAWNLVKIEGEWCHIDCTWDDPGIGGAENHSYFGMNEDLIARDHTWDKSSYISSTSLSNFYPIRCGELVFSNDSELDAILVPLFTSQAESITIQ